MCLEAVFKIYTILDLPTEERRQKITVHKLLVESICLIQEAYGRKFYRLEGRQLSKTLGLNELDKFVSKLTNNDSPAFQVLDLSPDPLNPCNTLPNDANIAIILRSVYDFWHVGEEVSRDMYPTLGYISKHPLVNFPTPHYVHEFRNNMQRPEDLLTEVAKKMYALPGCSYKFLTKTCSICGTVNYCSREHQKTHWKQHKKSCSARIARSPKPPAPVLSTPPATDTPWPS